MNIEFDPQAHVYHIDGKERPGITEVLRDQGLQDTTYYNRSAMERGSAVHEAIMLITRGMLGVADFDGSEIKGYVHAWQQFIDDTGAEIEDAERLVGDDTLGYCTHVDAVIKLQGKRTVFDYKTGQLAPWHGIQLAAGSLILDVRHRRILHLGKDGKYKLHDGYRSDAFDSRVWDKTWIAAITLYWWKRRYA